jgi:hypothetical protein
MIKRNLLSLFILLVGEEDANHSKKKWENGIKNGIKTLKLWKFSLCQEIKTKKDLKAQWKKDLGLQFP